MAKCVLCGAERKNISSHYVLKHNIRDLKDLRIRIQVMNQASIKAI